METIQPDSVKVPVAGKRVGKICVLVAAVLLALYLALCGYAASRDTIFPGVTVFHEPVGGMTVAQAEAVLSQRDPNLVQFTLYLTQPDSPQELVTQPTDGLYADLGGVMIDAPTSAQKAYDFCHDGGFLPAGWRYLRSLLGQSQLPPVLTAPELPNRAEALAKQYSSPAADTAYTLTETGISVTLAQDGWQIDPETLLESFQTQLADFQIANLSCPARQLPAQTLTAQEIYDALSGEVKNAGYDAETDRIIPEQVGASFDVAAAQTLLDGAGPGDTVTIPAEIEFPAVTAEQLKAVLFRDVLGSCTTHVGGSAARISNVKLSAAAFSGTVLNCGDVFSYNEVVGQRTAARGYQAAPAYVKGETVDEIGGGVCQPSSTLYYACLLSNLEITERYAHRYAPAYIDWGMDATVSWGGPDYRFTNNTNYPIKIVTTYAKGYLTVKLLGTKTDDVTVKMVSKTLSNTAFQTVEQEDATLAPGTTQVKVTPYTGHKVVSYRNLYEGGKLISSAKEAVSDYKARDKVVLKGPAVTPPVDPTVPTTDPALPTGGETTLPAGGETDTPVTDPTTPVTDPTTPVTPTEPTEPTDPAEPVSPGEEAEIPGNEVPSDA